MTAGAESRPFANLDVRVQAKKRTTGTQGRFQWEGLPAGTSDLTLAFEGPRVKVYGNSGAITAPSSSVRKEEGT